MGGDFPSLKTDRFPQDQAPNFCARSGLRFAANFVKHGSICIILVLEWDVINGYVRICQVSNQQFKGLQKPEV